MANPLKCARGVARMLDVCKNAPKKPINPFVEWLAEQALQGVRFSTLEQAEQAYANAKSEKQS